MKKSLMSIISCFLIMILMSQMFHTVGAQTLAERLDFSDNSAISDILFDSYYYSQYKEDNGAKKELEYSRDIDIFSYTSKGEAPQVFEDKEKGNVLHWTEKTEELTYKISVPEDSCFVVELEYYCIGGNSQDISRGIKIDGEYPFEEAKNVFLRRSYADAHKPKVNNLGDEVMPAQTELKRWCVTELYDNKGMYSEPLHFALKQGEHSISFKFINQPILISKITLKSAVVLPEYEEKKLEYKENGYKNVKNGIRFEAEGYENVLYKSASSILIGSSSDATMSPESVISKKYNYIGGDTWTSGGGSICWKFSVPETGLYKIALRSLQNANNGMPTTRRIEIDGEVPFAEMENYVFSYSSGWKTHVLGGEKPYLFYLEKGEHNLTLTAVNGEMTNIIQDITEANSRLSNCYQNIVMVTGQNPDVNYDYELDRSIPSLKGNLQEIIDILKSCSKRLAELTTETTTLENSIIQITESIEGYKKNMDAIPMGLGDFSNALTNMGDWLTTLQNQYLAVDYIEIASPDKKLENPKQSVLESIINTIRNLILSFTRDYNAIGSSNEDGGQKKESLEVWLSMSKEQAEILKDLADGDFAEKENVYLDINLLPSGAFEGTVNTLLLAVNAGNSPDVVLNMTGTNTAEYAVRGVVYDLTQFDDFEDYKKYTLNELYKTVTYNDRIYGLPEKMDISVMLYRTDIFEKLNIKVPDTWDDVYNSMLPKLYQYNMQMYMPPSYQIFMFQYGAQYYNEDMRYSALDSDSAIRAFEKFIGNYTDYGFPYSANFYNRFRTGEIPIGICTLTDYLSISYAAPELSGKWAMAPIPASVQADGTLNRSIGDIILSFSIMLQDTDKPELAWKFLKWWMDAETQSEYARRIESILGVSARWSTTNLEAFRTLPWSNKELTVIEDSWQWVRATCYVPGSYFTTRHISNAIARCITGEITPRDSLEQAVEQINAELQRKREELKLD